MLKKIAKPGHLRLSPDLIASLILVGAGIIFFSDFLFSSKNFYFRDILSFHYPLRKVLIDSYSRGEFPLWNPFLYLGQPMLANPNYMAFYPTNLLHLFMPFNYAFKLHFIIHPVLAGLGAFFLQRRLGIPCFPALTGALAYEFSGTVLSFLNLYNIVPAIALLPWIAWAFHCALQENRLRRSLLFGALLALQAIAFEPLMFQCVIGLLAGIAILHISQAGDRKRAAWTVAGVGFVGAVFGLGLSAIQVLPTLELLPLSGREGLNFGEGSMWSMHPFDFLSALVPNLFGNYYKIGFVNSWGEAIHQGRESYLVSFFLGAVTVLLAVLSFTSHRKKLRLVLIGLAIISIVLAFGGYNPLYKWLYLHIPFLAMGRFPCKYFLLTTLMVCIMASLGVESLVEDQGAASKRKWRIAIGGLLVGAGVLIFWIYLRTHPDVLEGWLRYKIGPKLSEVKDLGTLTAFLRQSILGTGVFLSLGSILMTVIMRMKKKVLLGAVLPLLVVAELIPANLRLSPLISDVDVNFVADVNNFIIKGLEEPSRIIPPIQNTNDLSELKISTPNRSLAWLTLFAKMCGQPFYGIMSGIHFSLFFSIDHLNTREAEVLYSASKRMPGAANLTLFGKLNSPVILSLKELSDSRLRLLSKFDTRSQYPVRAYWLDNVLKRAYFASGADFVNTQQDALERFLDPKFQAGTTIILEGRGGERTGVMEAGSVKILSYQNSRVLCEVNSKIPGYVVLLDSYYPGWIARIDGKKSDVLRANYAFRAVKIPAGKHRVEFLYRPVIFYIGLGVTSLSLLIGLLFIVWKK